MKKKPVLEGIEKFNRISKTSNFLLSALFIFFGLICVLPVILVFMISISSEQAIA